MGPRWMPLVFCQPPLELQELCTVLAGSMGWLPSETRGQRLGDVAAVLREFVYRKREEQE